MTSSQWLDMAVIAIAFIAAISGWRSGAVGSLLSFIGVVLGAVAGVDVLVLDSSELLQPAPARTTAVAAAAKTYTFRLISPPAPHAP